MATTYSVNYFEDLAEVMRLDRRLEGLRYQIDSLKEQLKLYGIDIPKHRKRISVVEEEFDKLNDEQNVISRRMWIRD